MPALAAAVAAAAPAQAAWASPAVLEVAVQAAHLCKADLATSTVTEMTALAGERVAGAGLAETAGSQRWFAAGVGCWGGEAERLGKEVLQ